MNNAVFGKTMENVRNHVDVRLLTHRSRNQFFIVEAFFSENLVAIEMRKLEVKFDKPIYVCILDISKCLYFIMSTCYHYIVKNVKLCIPIQIASYHIDCDIECI